MTGERPAAALAGDHGRDPAVLQPGEQPAQFGAQRDDIREGAEQRLDGVDHDPLGPDGVDRSAEPE